MQVRAELESSMGLEPGALKVRKDEIKEFVNQVVAEMDAKDPAGGGSSSKRKAAEMDGGEDGEMRKEQCCSEQRDGILV